MKKSYDAAFVPCKEPDLTTRQFPEHHTQCLRTAWELQQTGVVKFIVLAGRYATWYDNHNIIPWFGTECDASGDYLIGLGCPSEVILKEKRSQDSFANLVHSGQDIFIPKGMQRILVVTADERAPRLDFLSRKILSGVAAVDIKTIGHAHDPWLAQKELFTLAMDKRYLADIPDGVEGWPVLESWFYSDGKYKFWMRFDAAQQAMPAEPEGTILSIPDIVANMDTEGLPPDVVEFATATARDLAYATPLGRQHMYNLSET
jgi:hypothetical protein